MCHSMFYATSKISTGSMLYCGHMTLLHCIFNAVNFYFVIKYDCLAFLIQFFYQIIQMSQERDVVI